MSQDEDTILLLLWDRLLDAGDVILDSGALVSPIFWLCVLASLSFKVYYIQPRLERYCKSTSTDRERQKQRRLQATLQDPLLRKGLENRLARAYEGDRSKVLEHLQRLEERSTRPLDYRDILEETKGEEKVEAANQLFYGTIVLSLLLLLMQNLSADKNYSPWKQNEVPFDYFGINSHPIFPSGVYTFCLVHFIHSLHQMTQRKTVWKNIQENDLLLV